MTPLSDTKRALRATLRARLRDLSPVQRAAESFDLRRRIQDLPVFQNARTVSLFCPMPFEVDLMDLLHDANTLEKRFVFPLTHDDRGLTWHGGIKATDFIAGRMGVPEPDPANSLLVNPAEIDLVVVPGLGFTREGWRLGFGGGYYDRFLASLSPHIPTISACFSCQIVGELPVEPHDIRVHQVLHGMAV